MFNANELQFLREAFEKCRVQVTLHDPNDLISDIVNEQLRSIATFSPSNAITMHDICEELQPQTLYKVTDRFSLSYNYLLTAVDETPAVLLVGPYLSSPLSSEDILEIAERNAIPIASMKYVNEFYAGIPVIAPDDNIFIFLNTFCERLWDVASFSVVDLAENHEAEPVPSISEDTPQNDFDSVLMSMKLMEKRYGFENELMEAVTHGQIQKESQLFSSLSESRFEKRISDPLRNVKNYMIIMNTLLRKAAEKGGVHPFHLDKLSSHFASRIESMTVYGDHYGFMLEIFREYCRLVRKHAVQGLSPIVRRVALMIEADLSAHLSLTSLAQAQGISPGYLATVFKKETGKTVSEYIREKRVNQAKHLLKTTSLQVQTIALYCGVVDVQYFTKLFKKETGRTPKEYREHIQKNAYRN